MKFSDLWSWKGTIDRGAYAIWGCLLFAIKYNIDRVIAWDVIHSSWYAWYYLFPPTPRLEAATANLFSVFVIAALPFIYTGIVLIIRRIRSIGLPVWLAMLFFVPFVNLLFFFMLSILPARSDVAVKQPYGFWKRVIPENPVGAAAVGLVVNVLSVLIFASFSIEKLTRYGWGLFVGLPFCLGLTSVLIYSYQKRRSFASCIAVALASTGLACLTLIVAAFEGIVCLVMAAPLAGALAILGGIVGYVFQIHPETRYDAPKILGCLFIGLPLFMGVEHHVSPPAAEFVTQTSIDIDAPPKRVWPNVIAFAELPPPHEFLFRIGIAYPMRARIQGQGAGAVRRCEFSTGAFLEPIDVWDSPRVLRFSVTSNPAPLDEWTPYSAIHPPHLSGFLISKGGQFHLIPLPGGKTRLEGTTWYQHHLWPETYWQWWSDYIIHKIHLRVLTHIKQITESQTAS